MSTSRKLTGAPSAPKRGACSHTAQPSSWRSAAVTSEGDSGSLHARANAAERSAWSVWRTTCQASSRSRTIMGSLLRPGNEAAGSLELGDELGYRRYRERAAVDLELAGIGID